MKSIAIIGGGWTGIGILKVLSEKGYEVDLYEKNNDIGGTWHPDNCYAGLRIQSPASTIEYFDFPLPEDIDKTERITSLQVYNYLKNYCLAKNLYQYMQLNTHVKKISYNSSTKKSTLEVIESNDAVKTTLTKEYDYVVYTHGYTSRKIPYFQGSEKFNGLLLHSFDVNEKAIQSMIADHKRIVVIGGNKTATDFIIHFKKYAYKVTWLYREAYWFLKYENERDLVKIRSLGRKVPLLLKLRHSLPWTLLNKYPKMGLYVLRFFNILHTYGARHLNHKKFRVGKIDKEQMQNLRAYCKKYAIQGEIDEINEDKIHLKNGEIIDADIIICCTGSGLDIPSSITIEKDNEKLDLHTTTRVYRSRVVPEIPNLIFTTYHLFIFGPLNGLITGNWILKFIDLNPDSKYLFDNSKKIPSAFFTKPLLFNSDHSHVAESGNRLNEFISSGELSKEALKLMDDIYAYKYNKPIEFNLPKNC